MNYTDILNSVSNDCEKMIDSLKIKIATNNIANSLRVVILKYEFSNLSKRIETLGREAKSFIESGKIPTKEDLGRFKSVLASLKREQLERYNFYVDDINHRINLLPNEDNFDEVKKVDAVVKNWRQNWHLKLFDCDELIKAERLISNKSRENETVVDVLDIYLKQIHDEIKYCQHNIDKITVADLNRINSKRIYFAEKLVLFRDKIEEIKIEEYTRQVEIVTYNLENLAKRVDTFNKEKATEEANLNVDNRTPQTNRSTGVKNNDLVAITSVIGLLEREVTMLEERVAKYNKDKNERIAIERDAQNIAKLIEQIEIRLENNCEIDEKRYNVEKEKINELRERLEKINGNYYQKLPLCVKTKKSASAFYKKHKKAVLLGAGLAGVAYVHWTVGPIIIPAIMHGNLMLMAKLPQYADKFGTLNNILGSLINAKNIKINGVDFWRLANGVLINPDGAVISLKKGIAIAAITPVTLLVASIKQLITKMKTRNLKQRLETSADLVYNEEEVVVRENVKGRRR